MKDILYLHAFLSKLRRMRKDHIFDYIAYIMQSNRKDKETAARKKYKIPISPDTYLIGVNVQNKYIVYSYIPVDKPYTHVLQLDKLKKDELIYMLFCVYMYFNKDGIL